MSRSCARPGCSQGAVATLSYAYAESSVLLDDLAEESHPMTHDLCSLHADAVKVPRGWTLSDTRADPDPEADTDTNVGRSGSNGVALRLVGA